VEKIINFCKEKTDRAVMETYNAQSTISIEKNWGNIKRCIINNADEVFGKSKETKRKEWINEEILEMINEKGRYKNATDQRGMEINRKLKNAINREFKKSKDVFLNNFCQYIYETLKLGLVDKAYGMIKKCYKKRNVKTASIKEANGNIIYEEAKVAKYWKKYLEPLYRENDITIDAEIEEESQSDMDEVDQSLMREEFDKVLLELKNNKAPRVDEIPVELVKICGENTKKIIYELIQKRYETGPKDTKRFYKVHNCTNFKENNGKNM